MNTFYKNLPKKRMSSGTLIFNENGDILIVKPSYRDYWSVAGGIVDKNESPKYACLREVKEEIDIKLDDVRLLCVAYVADSHDNGDALEFIFFGGIFSESEIDKIKVDGEEIVEYKFLKPDDALPLLSRGLRARIKKSIEALKNNTVVYLE